MMNSKALHGLTSDFRVSVVTMVTFTYALCSVFIDNKKLRSFTHFMDNWLNDLKVDANINSHMLSFMFYVSMNV